MKKLLPLLLSLPFAAPVLAAPSAQVFDAVKKPESLDAQWRAHLCGLLPQPCDVQELGLYRPRGASPNDYVVLSGEPLVMAPSSEASMRRAGSSIASMTSRTTRRA